MKEGKTIDNVNYQELGMGELVNWLFIVTKVINWAEKCKQRV